MKTIGYMEGTDPILLTRLIVNGVYTLPLGNGVDNHGKFIGLLTKSDKVSAVVGYLHKFMPPKDPAFKLKDRLYSCELHGIPVFAIVPHELQEQAKAEINEAIHEVNLIDPSDLWDELAEILEIEGAGGKVSGE